MAPQTRQIIVSLDAALYERAVAYGAEHQVPLEALIDQALRLRLDGALSPAEERVTPAPPDLVTLADHRIREQLPRIIREWLESPRGAETLVRLVAPYAPEPGPAAALDAPETAEGGDVPLPLSVLARLQRQRMIRLEEATGVDIPTLHLLRTGKQSRLPKEMLERLVVGLEEVEADTESDHELEGMHG